MVLLYGGDQRYDIRSRTLSVDVILKNKSKEPIRAPLLLRALKVSSQLGNLEIANPSNGATGPEATWDLSKALPNGVLQPGAATKPYSVMFRIPNGVAPPEELEVVSMQLKVLAATTGPPDKR